jgi:SNF2 family DNA or RNA helicase
VIISYQTLSQPEVLKSFRQDNFKVVIIDEASFLKPMQTVWSETLTPFFHTFKRTIILTGSDLLKNPIQVHNILKIVRPDYIPDFLKFSSRYCDPHKTKEGVQFMGASFSAELDLIYTKRFAYRRERSDPAILSDIPRIQRQKVEISGNIALVE